jgi:hypothetical protein
MVATARAKEVVLGAMETSEGVGSADPNELPRAGPSTAAPDHWQPLKVTRTYLVCLLTTLLLVSDTSSRLIFSRVGIKARVSNVQQSPRVSPIYRQHQLPHAVVIIYLSLHQWPPSLGLVLLRRRLDNTHLRYVHHWTACV